MSLHWAAQAHHCVPGLSSRCHHVLHREGSERRCREDSLLRCTQLHLHGLAGIARPAGRVAKRALVLSPLSAAGMPAARAAARGAATAAVLLRGLWALPFLRLILAPPRLVRLRAGERPASTPRRLLVLLLPPVHCEERSAKQAGSGLGLNRCCWPDLSGLDGVRALPMAWEVHAYKSTRGRSSSVCRAHRLAAAAGGSGGLSPDAFCAFRSHLAPADHAFAPFSQPWHAPAARS